MDNKKTSFKKKTRQNKATNQKKVGEDQRSFEQEEKPFDFGGLPQRDLKKNLGCG